MRTAGGTFHIQIPTRTIFGRFTMHVSQHRFLAGVIHTVCANPVPADMRYIDAALPPLTRQWSKRYPGALWYLDGLLVEPRIRGVAQSGAYSMDARTFYGSFLGAPDPFSAHRLLHQTERMRDTCFLTYLGHLSGSFTTGGLLFKLRFLAEHFEPALARLARSVSWKLVVYVQVGPSARKVVTFQKSLDDPEACIGLLGEQLESLANGGHSAAPVTSRVELKATKQLG